MIYAAIMAIAVSIALAGAYGHTPLPKTDGANSISFLSGSIGGSVWEDWGAGLELLLEAEGIGPNTRFWNGRDGLYYTFWTDFDSLFRNPDTWHQILSTDCPDGAECHSAVMFKVCVGPCMYWHPDHAAGDYAALGAIADFVDDHPDVFFIPWSCLPNCDYEYVGGNPHLPWVTEDLNEWMADTFDPKPNARLFDAWSILADDNGLLRDEYQNQSDFVGAYGHTPLRSGQTDEGCDFHPNRAGQEALRDALYALILEELPCSTNSAPELLSFFYNYTPGDSWPVQDPSLVCGRDTNVWFEYADADCNLAGGRQFVETGGAVYDLGELDQVYCSSEAGDGHHWGFSFVLADEWSDPFDLTWEAWWTDDCGAESNRLNGSMTAVCRCLDGDGDGYAGQTEECWGPDCDDASPVVNPGIPEQCGSSGRGNGVDDNCDGEIDEGCDMPVCGMAW